MALNIRSIKSSVLDNAKNIIGWKTKRKIVVFSVDDYGNVRLSNPEARTEMLNHGYLWKNKFDNYDTLETEDDLNALYETLNSVKDKNGNPAVFTAFAVPVNIDFEKMQETGYGEYHYEILPDTLKKLPGYENVWNLWKEGMENKLIHPEYHGREHFNLKVFKELLKNRDPQLLASLATRSNISMKKRPFKGINGYTAAFSFTEMSENEELKEIMIDGLDQFEKVFGFRSTHFNAPGGTEHTVLHKSLVEHGVKFCDANLIKAEYQGSGHYKKIRNHTGKKSTGGLTLIVRNCLFEPSEKTGFNWVDYAMRQVETAFRWNRPANISSHRVNFCGMIDENFRKVSLDGLKELLQRIVKKYPDVEFMTSSQLGELINK